MKMKWNWWKKDNSTLEALKEALDELNQKTWELNYYKEYTDSLERELATYKKQIKEYDELVEEDWTE